MQVDAPAPGLLEKLGLAGEYTVSTTQVTHTTITTAMWCSLGGVKAEALTFETMIMKIIHDEASRTS